MFDFSSFRHCNKDRLYEYITCDRKREFGYHSYSVFLLLLGTYCMTETCALGSLGYYRTRMDVDNGLTVLGALRNHDEVLYHYCTRFRRVSSWTLQLGSLWRSKWGGLIYRYFDR